MANPIFFFKWANPGLFLFYFHSFLIIISIQIAKSIDGVLGIRTRGRRMVGADKTTELWRLFSFIFCLFKQTNRWYNFTTNQCEKYPFSIWCCNSNPQPHEHEPSPITTRPRLLAKNQVILKKHRWCGWDSSPRPQARTQANSWGTAASPFIANLSRSSCTYFWQCRIKKRACACKEFNVNPLIFIILFLLAVRNHLLR